ncbi:MAG TPA: AraC family transcriptional regulator [Chitinophaga sp.]|uniref:helix-turn-helix transcriptional regulator n=1 Tax=Chitinophaga sp. TaxID=1869181 RepID=UPI002C246EA5|nr:AraC family transcriptional regulator [Chitinophaga sp.]HVI47255.1 AraC family transcriptional regulator [Chitinophaga sp.]
MKFVLPRLLQKELTSAILHPPHKSDSLLPYLSVACMDGPFGDMRFQQFSNSELGIYNYSFCLKEDIPVLVDLEQPMITLSYALSGNVPFLLNGFGETGLTEGWYHLYYVPAGRYKATLPEGDTTAFQVNLYPEHIKGLGDKYAPIREVWEQTISKSRRGLQQEAAKITPRVSEILKGIYQCRLEDAEWEIFLLARVYDLLLLYVEELNGLDKDFCSQYHFTEGDLRALREASAILAGKLHQPVSQRMLARLVHLHPKKLTAGFRLLYGVGVQEWLQRVRMEKARLLLAQGNTKVSDIAYEVGYDTVSGFIRAFKGVAGCTPAEYRK